MTTRLAWISVAGTILLTIYGQIAIKWRVQGVVLPEAFSAKLWTLLHLLFDPWIFSAMACAVIASLFWMSAMTKLPLSLAYPFTSLSFVIVAVVGIALMGEPFSMTKAGGIGLVVIGLILLARG